MNDVPVVRRMLDGHDPVAVDDLPPVDRQLLARVLAAGRAAPIDPARPKRRRRALRVAWLVPVTAAATLAAVLLTQGALPRGGVPAAQAATPPSLAYSAVPGTAAGTLEAIAAGIRSRPAGSSPAGPYLYVRTQSWDLATRVDGRQVTSAVLPRVREIWRAANGSGRVRVTPGAPYFPSQQARDAWAASGSPSVDTTDENLKPGELGAGYPIDLPADASALAKLMAAGHPVANGPYETLVAVGDLYDEQTPTAPVRAAVLDVLAATPGLLLYGVTVDRAGRPALAIGLESAGSGLPTRYTLLIDQSDGRLLGSEATLTKTAGALGVPVPSVISYTTYLDATRTDTPAPPR
jgi:hypothetical protein